MTQQTIPIAPETLQKITEDGIAVTYHFDHAADVTVVAEKNRQKWSEHDRPEDAGVVVFLDKDDTRRLRYSKTGFVKNGVKLVREVSSDGTKPELEAAQ